jgi:hypothetical protein
MMMIFKFKLDRETELLFNATLAVFNDGKMTKTKLAKLCFNQGLERISKSVQVNHIVDAEVD